MKILNIKKMREKDLVYECYSQNLYKFLFLEKNIHPVDSFTHNTTKKMAWIFVKSERLQDALDEWKNNKTIKEV